MEGNSTAGYVTAVRINTADLYGGQNFMDPCIYTRHFEEDPDVNEPMVMYARDPGMVIEYTIAGPWVKGIAAPNSSDEFVFAFFVPITHKKLKSDLSEHKYAGMELGEYLRECEASDHMGWDDPANMRVVERIQRNTSAQISSTVADEKTEHIEAAASKLSGKLGRKLLPKVGYGRSKSGGAGGSNGGSGSKNNNIEFSILSKSFEGSELTLEYELKLLHGKKTAEYTLLIDSEGGLIDPNSWNGDIGTGFPIEISQIGVSSLSSSVEPEKRFSDMLCNSLTTETVNDYVALSMCNEAGAFVGFKIVSEISSPIIKGVIKLKTTDKKYRPAYKIM